MSWMTKATAFAWMVLLGTIAVGLAADLGSKSLAFNHIGDVPIQLDRAEMIANPRFNPIPWDQAVVPVPGVLKLRLALNRGAVFGIGANQRSFFIGFTLVAIGLGLHVFRRMIRPTDYGALVALGAILAGGLGNLYDRIQLAAVRDFIQLLPGYRLPNGWTWPGGNWEMFPWVFNIADVLLLVGMIALMRYLSKRRQERAAEEESVAVAAA